MPLIGQPIGYRLLKWIHPPRDRNPNGGEDYESSEHKLRIHFGDRVFDRVAGKTIIDFGCGLGNEAIEYAKRGADQVIGLEIREELRARATTSAIQAGVDDRCTFQETTDTPADIVVSLDSFEHFHEPGKILKIMSDLLKDDGEIWVSFGWSWYHPRGGHLFSVFPWAHLIFTEAALIRWRSDFTTDGATRFHEVAGGLNQMTIGRFEQLVEESSLQFEELTLRPIKPLRFLHCRATREFTTSLVFGRLKKRYVSQDKKTSDRLAAV